jgi:hypothetical protein
MPTTSRGRITLAEEGSQRPRLRRTAIRLILLSCLGGLVVAGWLGVRGVLNNLGGPRCQATALDRSVDFDPSQTSYAATITAIAAKRGLPPRAATIAIATAIQESKLRNLRYGDRDSVGLFQQRPSQGWGTVEQILDPVYATNRFYDALVKIKGYESMEITKIAQEVQKSAYPEAYADHEQEGRLLASTLTGHSPGGLGCRLDDATGGDPPALLAGLERELGVTASADGSTLAATGTTEVQAWSIGAYAVAKADAHGVTRVRVGDREWRRTRDGDGWEWHNVGGDGAPTAVTITLAG